MGLPLASISKSNWALPSCPKKSGRSQLLRHLGRLRPVLDDGAGLAIATGDTVGEGLGTVVGRVWLRPGPERFPVPLP